jgi:hypothetical protein
LLKVGQALSDISSVPRNFGFLKTAGVQVFPIPLVSSVPVSPGSSLQLAETFRGLCGEAFLTAF